MHGQYLEPFLISEAPCPVSNQLCSSLAVVGISERNRGGTFRPPSSLTTWRLHCSHHPIHTILFMLSYTHCPVHTTLFTPSCSRRPIHTPLHTTLSTLSCSHQPIHTSLSTPPYPHRPFHTILSFPHSIFSTFSALLRGNLGAVILSPDYSMPGSL